jgi:hypothetical protein
MPATYEPIATTTLGSNASSITFTSIASTWTDIKLIAVLKGAGTSPTFRARVNSSTTTIYSHTAIDGNGTSATSSRGTGLDYIATGGTTISATNPEFYELDFFSYAGSTNKTMLVGRSADYNGSGDVERYVNLWRSTTAISSIQLYANLFNASGLFATGSTATLYGIKAA